jgi:hypothetical protein
MTRSERVRYSVQRSAMARSAYSSQGVVGSATGPRATCTVDVATIDIASCGSSTSNVMTWLPK